VEVPRVAGGAEGQRWRSMRKEDGDGNEDDEHEARKTIIEGGEPWTLGGM
jgi:hypothetical protein